MGEFFEEEMGKKRGRFVILQRSRREHYDLVLSEGEETLGMTCGYPYSYLILLYFRCL